MIKLKSSILAIFLRPLNLKTRFFYIICSLCLDKKGIYVEHVQPHPFLPCSTFGMFSVIIFFVILLLFLNFNKICCQLSCNE